jgi:protoheme IX farnesyltransferase
MNFLPKLLAKHSTNSFRSIILYPFPSKQIHHFSHKTNKSLYLLKVCHFSQNNTSEGDKGFCFSKESSLTDKPIEEAVVKRNNDSLVIEKTKHKVLLKDIMEITKFKLCLLNLSVSLSTYVYYSAHITLWNLPFFAFGTFTAAMTTQVLNQIMERIYDKKMKRTQMRPLPKQRMTTREAYTLAIGLWSASMGAYLITSPSSILFTGSILSLYIFCYTPLKRKNNLSMHVGALVGALPALLGSYGVTGAINLSFEDPAFLLASYIFCWQYPHFYGILYQNKEDYSKAGFKFISNDDSKLYIAYGQLLLACIAILGIVYKMKERKIMNDYTLAAFFGFYVYNVIPAVLFIRNPNKYAKIMRVRSYTPFLIILGSFINASINKELNEKIN